MDASRHRLSRASARLLVGLVALTTLVLGLTNLRAGLPAVFHSDYVQVEQAVELLDKGVVRDQTVYPVTLVFAYAAADLVAFAVGTTLGWQGYESWQAFLVHLARPEVHHAIGRALGAVCAVLLAVAVYRIARLRFDRGVAVLAAAIAAFCPLQTIYAHQVRPHVPVITLAALLGPAILRVAGQTTVRAGLRAGAAAGLVNGVFQVGMPLGVAAVGLAVLFTRPVRALPRVLLGIVAGFAGAWLSLRFVVQHGGLVTEGVGSTLMAGSSKGGLGFGLKDMFADLGRVPELAAQWVAAEPLRAAAVLAFLVLCAARRRSWRDAILYGMIPTATIVAIGFIMGARPRYSMYATPFLAPLAASACFAVPGRAARAVVAALLVLAPLASSLRIDQLLARTDTRTLVLDVLPGLTAGKLRTVVQADLVSSAPRLPVGSAMFPPGGDYMRWFQKKETPEQTFKTVAPDVFVRGRGDAGLAAITPVELGWFGFELTGRLGADRAFVPDEPLWLLPELWLADRPGPPMDVWAHGKVAARARAALPAELRAP